MHATKWTIRSTKPRQAPPMGYRGAVDDASSCRARKMKAAVIAGQQSRYVLEHSLSEHLRRKIQAKAAVNLYTGDDTARD